MIVHSDFTSHFFGVAARPAFFMWVLAAFLFSICGIDSTSIGLRAGVD